MTKREYFNLAMQYPVTWLIGCMNNPSANMTKTHVLLIRLAIRKKETIAA